MHIHVGAYSQRDLIDRQTDKATDRHTKIVVKVYNSGRATDLR